MSSSDSPSSSDSDDEKVDPVLDAWYDFKTMYDEREEVTGSVELNDAQKEQFEALVDAMLQYEEAEFLLNKRQQFIFHKIYIDEPLKVYRWLRFGKRFGKGGRPYSCNTKPMTLESDNDVDVLCYALDRCRTVKILSLDGVKITSIGTANIERIANAVAKHKSLKTLSWREAGFKKVAPISKIFSKHCSLESLNLSRNNVGDSGSEDLPNMLVNNSSMKELHLNDNAIGEYGVKSLIEALLHNHVCRIKIVSEDLDGMELDYKKKLNKNFSNYEFAVECLSQINKIQGYDQLKGDKSVERAAFAKVMLILKAKEPENAFEACLSSVFDGIEEELVTQLLTTCFKKVDAVVLQQVLSKRNAIDLSGDDDVKVGPDGTGIALQNQIRQRDEYGATLKKVKIENEATEDALAEAKEDANPTKDSPIPEPWIDAMLSKIPGDFLVWHLRKRKIIDLSTDEEIGQQPDGTGIALQNQVKQRDKYGATLKKVKTEKLAAEDALAEAKEDVEDANELIQQQSDKWQGKFDDLAKLAEAAGVDLQKVNEIRYRP